ncbi:MAG: hypothetical protein KIS78_12605 [Labilithrix sp.]|nr:hypothetical protein [Labilithrix sp.]
MIRRTAPGALALTTLLFATWSARAEGDGRFGERGQLVVTADRLVPIVGYTTQSITAVQGDTTTKVTESGASLALFVGREPSLGAMHSVPRVAADVTVWPRLTIGGSFVVAFGIGGTRAEERRPSVGRATARENVLPGSTVLGFAPRVGYVLRLTDTLAFWPRAGLAFYSVRSEREQTNNVGVTSAAAETDTVFSLDLDPQLVWTPLPHVLLHAGPVANLPLTGSHETAFVQGPDAEERSDALSIFHLGVSAGLGFFFDL